MHHRIQLELTIPMGGRWHAGSGEGNLLTDRLVRRDARNRPYIPGSTVKGVIRESCERLSRLLGFPEPSDPHQRNIRQTGTFDAFDETDSPVDRIFGTKRIPGELFFRDARPPDAPGFPSFSRNRIARYRALGTTRHGHLFSTEYAPETALHTKVDGWHQNLVSMDEEYPPFAYCLLMAGILAVDRVGGDKSTGSGWLAPSIAITSAFYNGAEIQLDDIFELLDPADYRELLKGGNE